jgi:hypothetical protein
MEILSNVVPRKMVDTGQISTGWSRITIYAPSIFLVLKHEPEKYAGYI